MTQFVDTNIFIRDQTHDFLRSQITPFERVIIWFDNPAYGEQMAQLANPNSALQERKSLLCRD